MNYAWKCFRDRWFLCSFAIVATIAAAACWALWPAPPVAPILAQAEAAIQSKDFTTARRILDRAIARNPKNEDLHLALARLDINENQRERAIESLRHVGDRPPVRGARARFLEGAILLDINRAREAERLLRRAVELDPYFADPHLPLRHLYIVQLRRDEMRTYLEAVRQVRGWNLGDLTDFLLVGHSLSWEVPRSVERMATYVKADPDDADSRIALAHYRSVLGQHDETARIAEEIIQRFPHDPRGWALLADSHISLNDPNAAADFLGKTPIDCPPHAGLWRTLGRLAEEFGDLEQAIACFQEAVRLDPEDERATYRLAVGLQQAGRQSEADTFFAHARVLNQLVMQIMRPGTVVTEGKAAVAEALLELSRSYIELGRYTFAMLCLEQVRQLDPANSVGRELFAHAMSERTRQAESDSKEPALNLADTRVAIVRLAKRERPGTDLQHLPNDTGTQVRMQDVAAQTGIAFQYFTGETGNKYLIESMGGGVAVLDFDGDGWPDLYFTQGSRLPVVPSDTTHTDLLFRNRGDGTFVDLTNQARLGDPGYSLGCAAGDWDNDGFTDLFVANYGVSRVFRNNGDGTFADITDSIGVPVAKMSLSAAWADFDRDGDLDLYVVNYLTKIESFRNAAGEVFTANPQFFDGEQDLLLLNLGDGTLEDITDSSGIVAPDGKGLGVITADLDGDEWPDIYVANDTTPNFLFHNRGRSGNRPSFTEQGVASGTGLNGHGKAEAGMGIACADFDRNELLDLHVTNFYGETNTLYLNRGNLLFVDATRGAGLLGPTVSMLGFGTQALDVDRDGWLDLFVANGHIDRVPDVPWKMRPQLFRNRGNARFADSSADSGDYFRGEYLGRGAARLDWNRDGRPDLVVVHQDQPAALLTNETGNSNHFVALDLIGSASNRDAISAWLRITAGGQTQIHEICGGDGFLASNERRHIFGLGAAHKIDRLEVRWPSGRRDSWSDLSVDRTLVIVEGRSPQ